MNVVNLSRCGYGLVDVPLQSWSAAQMKTRNRNKKKWQGQALVFITFLSLVFMYAVGHDILATFIRFCGVTTKLQSFIIQPASELLLRMHWLWLLHSVVAWCMHEGLKHRLVRVFKSSFKVLWNIAVIKEYYNEVTCAFMDILPAVESR